MRKWLVSSILILALIAFACSDKSENPQISSGIGIEKILPLTALSGDTVSIYGHGFGEQAANSSVSIGGATAEITAWRDTYIGAIVPELPTDANPIVIVRNASGANTSTRLRLFWLDRYWGPAGRSVGIHGKLFGDVQNDGKVLMNGAAIPVGSWSDSIIVATIPDDAESGDISVIARGWQRNVGRYDVLRITVINPAFFNIGDAVTVIGSAFGETQGTSSVKFNTAEAAILSWSNTSIEVAVPSNARSGTLTVVRGSYSSNSMPYEVFEEPEERLLELLQCTQNIELRFTGITEAGKRFDKTLSNQELTFAERPPLEWNEDAFHIYDRSERLEDNWYECETMQWDGRVDTTALTLDSLFFEQVGWWEVFVLRSPDGVWMNSLKLHDIPLIEITEANGVEIKFRVSGPSAEEHVSLVWLVEVGLIRWDSETYPPTITVTFSR